MNERKQEVSAQVIEFIVIEKKHAAVSLFVFLARVISYGISLSSVNMRHV